MGQRSTSTDPAPHLRLPSRGRWRPTPHPHPPRPPPPPHAAHVACCSYLEAHELFSTPHFSDADWDRQKSWLRLLPHSTTVFFRVLAFYYPPLLVIACISVAIGLYETLGPPGHPGWPALSSNPHLKEPFALTSFILGLLLVFKTNAAYDRWAEARAVWGGLLADVRSLAREVCVWAGGRVGVKGGDASAAVADALAWDAALLYVLRRHLARDEDGPGGPADAELARELAPLLPPPAIAWLLASPRRPAAAALALSAALARLPVSDLLLASLEARVHAYSAGTAACERLRRQPVPVAWSRHSGRFLVIWLAPLAAVFWGDWGWASVPLAVVITFLTCGVDNIGAQLEQPFDVLPLAMFARTGHGDVSDAAAGWAGLLSVGGGGGGGPGGAPSPARPPPWPVPARPPPPRPESAGGESEDDVGGAGV